MKRVLVITRNFPPLLGGMERLNRHLVEELSSCFDIRLIAPEGAAEYVSAGVAVAPVKLRPLSRFLLGAAWHAMRQARLWRPDIVLAGSGLTAPQAVLAARCCGAKAIAYTHGLDLTVPHPLYRALWLPAIRNLDEVIVNSSATAVLAHGVGVAKERLSIVHPGVTLPRQVDSAAGLRFRSRHQLGSGLILVSVGRLAARKGLREFVTLALPDIVKAHPDVMLVVIGTPPDNALYAEAQSPESIQAAADCAGVGGNIRFLGEVDNATLSDAYASANMHVFPVRHIPNDPEGFGMVAIEAAAYGVPTVAYATGGVVDAVADGVSGRLIEPGNTAAFAEAVIALLDSPLDQDRVNGFARQFAWSLFGERLCEVVQRVSTAGRQI